MPPPCNKSRCCESLTQRACERREKPEREIERGRGKSYRGRGRGEIQGREITRKRGKNRERERERKRARNINNGSGDQGKDDWGSKRQNRTSSTFTHFIRYLGLSQPPALKSNIVRKIGR